MSSAITLKDNYMSFRGVLLSIVFCLSSLLRPLSDVLAVSEGTECRQDSQECRQMKIEEIKLEGLERVSEEYIMSVILTKVGENLDSLKIRKDIERLFGLGFFEDIKVVFSHGNLRFVFREKPIISEIKVEGRKKLSEEKLGEAIFLKEGDFFDEQKLQKQVERIKEEYMKEGYILASVTPNVEFVERENRVNVVLKVDEGERFRVRKIMICGAEKLDEEKIKEEFETKERNILRDIEGSSVLDLLKLQRDQVKLKYAYLDNGFLDVRTEDPVVIFDPLKRESFLIFRVEEGIRYKVKKIDVHGDTMFSREQILENLKTKKEDFFSRKKVLEDMDWISSLYQDIGFAQTTVIPSISKVQHTGEHGYVTVDLKINRSRMFYVRRINITGNTRTRDFVIRREISLLEGEVFGRTLLLDSYMRLMRSGYFENVEITPYFSPDGFADVNVRVKEGRVGAISLGGGFSPFFGNIVESLSVMFQGNVANFRGLGQNLGFYVVFGGGIAFFNFYLRDEHVFDTDYIAGVNVFRYQSAFLPFMKRTLGVKPNFGLFLSRKAKVLIYPGFEIISVYNRIGEPIPLYQDDVGAGFGRSDLRFLRLEFVEDARDNVLSPTKGRYAVFWTEIGGAFGGDLYFVKLGSVTSFFIPLGLMKAVFSPSFRIGVGLGITESRFLPYPKRFFAGGIYTIRGFDYFSLGPKQEYSYNDQLRTIVLGGNKMVISNIELVVPISRQAGIFLVPFVDVGQVFGEREPVDPLELRLSTGVEFRWISPLGPLRFSFGYPLIRKKDDRTRFFDFSLGIFTFYPEFEEY